ncbi:MAG: hypothetical protein J0L54_08175 [Chitinophagales bacterium]|nr:hypothetical protein [Chitinophagales bacterium]
MDKIEYFKSQFNQLTFSYIDNYNGKQPVYKISDDEIIEIEPELLDYLPPDVSSLIKEIVNKTNGF